MKIESHYVMIVGIILLAMLAVATTFYALSRPTSLRYSGTVVSVEEWGFTVDGHRQPALDVLITEETRLFSGRAAATAVTAGDFVVILGRPNDTGKIEALVVRILSDIEFRR